MHASTPQHSKDVITLSLLDSHGIVRVVFASVAMGMMGVDLRGVNRIIHYGDPREGGRSGDSAHSVIYWAPADCPSRKEP